MTINGLDMNKSWITVVVLYFFFVIVGSGRVNAQKNSQKKVDSLRHLISSSKDDTLKIARYVALSRMLLRLDQHAKMLATSKEGLSKAQEMDYPKGIGQMTLYKAVALDVQGRPDEAIPLYNEGLEMAQKLGDGELQAKFYMNLGLCYRYTGDLDLALKNQLLAYDLSHFMNKNDRARLLNNLGVLYRFQEKHERAVEMYEKSFRLKEALNDSLGMANTLMNMGLVSYRMPNKEEMAITYLEKAQNLFRCLGRPQDVASCNTALGEVLLDQGNIIKAKEVLAKAWSYFKNNVHAQYSPSTLSLLGSISLEENDNIAAEAYYTKVLELVTAFGQKKDQVEILVGLSDIKHSLGKSGQAYHMLKEAFALNDTLNQTTRLEAIEEMQIKFEVKEKENELKINQLSLNERTHQRNIFLLGTTGFALFALTIFFLLRNRIKANKKIALQTEEIQAQKITELQQQNKLLALNSMIEGQETERVRIAKDLHDSLGGLLSSVKAHFTTIQNEIKQLKKMNLAVKTNELIDEACVEVRRISHNMIPHALTLSGLPTVLEDMAEYLKNQNYDVDLDIRNFPDGISQTKQAMLYRLLQEVISNIRKHAKANTILIQLFGLEKGVGLIIEDDGVGFDYEKAVFTNGIGIKSINSRVEFLDGTIDWDSNHEGGTTITISIPEI